MKSFAVIPLLASAAWAFTTPAGISTTCGAYLQSLDKDTSLASCTSAITNATSAFTPGSSGSASVQTALTTLASSNVCSEASVRTALTNFYAACQQELAADTPNTAVLQVYDALYVVYPLSKALTSKDDSGNFCGAQSLNTPPAADSLYTGSSQQTLTPNFDNLKSSNAAFLFLDPSQSKDKLCVACTRSIMTSYMSFESDLAYGPGMSKSILLAGQSPLYQAVQSTCGASFLNGAVQAAGSLSDGILGGSSGAASIRAGNGVGAIASLLGAAALAVAAGF